MYLYNSNNISMLIPLLGSDVCSAVLIEIELVTACLSSQLVALGSSNMDDASIKPSEKRFQHFSRY